ncbi:winged helix DNA-binding domain-containing protein [Nocardioides ferulae]|uniref:winged helix DNA-binding domain-containing protein n=1 Tax=Nocardioides ferulae TaxID=2340821 RepID=UPI000EABFD04|nr:winged helix DNA-binding domain-containing protein [Nocardioides ferulae]
MPLTARALNRATLARQLLLERADLPVADAVRRVLALQAQQPASPYLALWNRVRGFDPAEVDAAFADGRLLKASLMRVTLHAVAADDHPSFHLALQPLLRTTRFADPRVAESGLSVAEVEGLLPPLLDLLAHPKGNAEVEAWLTDRVGASAKGVWWLLRCFAPLVHAPTGPPWSFGLRPAYTRAPHWLPFTDDPPGVAAADSALAELARRYLLAFGPATVSDLAQFTRVQRTRARRALLALGDAVVELEDADGAVLYDVPGASLPDEDTPAPPRLLPMWDSLLLAHADRSRVIPPAYRREVIRSNGDVLPTLLVDGRVAGVWRPVDGAVEATAFESLSGEQWSGLEAEAASLAVLLAERDPRTYRRYDRWWTSLPATEVRLLPR